MSKNKVDDFWEFDVVLTLEIFIHVRKFVVSISASRLTNFEISQNKDKAALN